MKDDEKELLAIIERDGANAYTTDRKLLGAILTCRDYMIAGRMFLPIDPEQAEQALINGTGVFLMRQKPGPLAQELAMRDMLHQRSIQVQKSINEIYTDEMFMASIIGKQPHEIRALIRKMPPEHRQWFIDKLPPDKRPRDID